MKTSVAMFQAKPHQTSVAMFIQNYHIVLDTRQAKPHFSRDNAV